MNKLFKFTGALFLFVILLLAGTQSVHAATMMPSGKATIWWKSRADATKYRIYFREAGEKKYTHAARGLQWPATSYTITFLKPGVTYKYQVAAVKDDGSEFWWSPVKSFWGNGGNYMAW